jgi:hypothetical protein
MCCTAVHVLVRFGYLPSRTSLLRYYELLEREMLHVVSLPSMVDAGMWQQLKRSGIHSDYLDPHTFGTPHACMVQPALRWSVRLRVRVWVRRHVRVGYGGTIRGCVTPCVGHGDVVPWV